MKVWVAEIDDGWTTTKFELCSTKIKALAVATDMMIEVFGEEGTEHVAEGPTRFVTIADHGGQIGLTKILCVMGLEAYPEGAPEAAIYEKEILE